MKLTKLYNKLSDKWEEVKDYRGDTLYEKLTGKAATCDYLGELKSEHTDVPAPYPFYHNWNEDLKSWIENKDKKKRYLITELNERYDEIFAELRQMLASAELEKADEKINKIRETYSLQKSQYDEELKKIIEELKSALSYEPLPHFCHICAAIMNDKGEYWLCPDCGRIEYKN